MHPPHIALIVGPKNSGKTAYLQHLIRRSRLKGRPVCGILSHGVWANDEKSGYELETVADGKIYPLAGPQPEGLDAVRCGPYYFAPALFELAISELIRCSGKRLVVVDEFGPLEADGQGIWRGIEYLLHHHTDGLVIAVRPSLKAELLRRIRTHIRDGVS